MFLSMFQIFFVMGFSDNSVSNLAPISSGPGDLLILSSFNVSNSMSFKAIMSISLWSSFDDAVLLLGFPIFSGKVYV